MQGQITKFRSDIGVGVITTRDGNKFRFTKDEVMNLNGRLVGYEVDFLVKTRKPREIILMTGTPWSVFGRKGVDQQPAE